MKPRRRLLLALLLAAAPALAQTPAPTPTVAEPPRAPGQPEMSPTQRMVTLSSGQHIFETMALTGPDGKIIRIDGALDLLALQRNPLVTGATRERLRKPILDWNAELERIVVDNADFLDKIEPADGSPGLLDTLDSNNNDQMRTVQQVVTQLQAAGNLSNTLNGQGLLDRDQYALNQHIVAEYLQRCMSEVTPPNEAITTPEQSLNRTNRYNRFLYGVSASDALATWHRLLVQAAPNLDRIVAGLKLPAEQAAKLKDGINAAKTAGDDLKRRRAVRAVFDTLTFTQKQEALRAAAGLAPPFDPFPAASAQAPAASSGQPKTGG